ncbi:MAG: transglutaminase domain-containing protein [Spirochaetales bacterium]|nr:transglutaminase domain-containing protein [Spirochaetales bacterium]
MQKEKKDLTDPINDLTPYLYPLRQDIANLCAAGYLKEASNLIDSVIESVDEMEASRLRLEKQMLKLRIADYPFSEQQARSILDSQAPTKDLDELRTNGTVPFALVNGKIHYHVRFMDTICKDKDDAERMIDLKLRDSMVELISKKGRAEAMITAHIGIKLAVEAVKPGRKLNVELPIPVSSSYLKDLSFGDHSPGLKFIDAPDCPMRRAHFETEASEDGETWIEYTAHNVLTYHDFEQQKEEFLTSDYVFNDEAPYLIRTPYLEQLAHMITKDEPDLLKKAHLIYSYITQNVKYAYMPSYQTISNLAEYGATMRRGDCGIQACLFIILCRLSGIQADWQGGMYVTPDGVSNHDWAVFRIPGLKEPWFADCSFGGGAWREGNMDRWKFYFGNLDLMRFPCCTTLACHQVRQDGFWRNDPTDNQSGEAFYEDHQLMRNELIDTRRTVSFIIP